MTARQEANKVYKMTYGPEKARAVWDLSPASKRELLKVCRAARKIAKAEAR